MVNFATSILLLSILISTLFEFSCLQKAYSNINCIDRERRALLQFRNGLIDPSHRLSSWKGEDCCNWQGVACSKNTRHVVKLDLRNPNYQWNESLIGEISSSLLALKHLSYLDLSWNNFSGIQIPKFFGSFKDLKYLNLSRSSFTGNIPRELGNLSRLQQLDLSWQSNLMVESMSWVTKLSSIKSLDLSSADLSGSQDWFGTINMLPSLTSLKLGYCRFTFLPNILHVNLTSLSILDLRGNSLVSTIPLWLFNMTSLEHLDLSQNDFHGLIPNKFSQLTSLTSLYLRNTNKLMTPLPNSLGSLNNLHHLDLSFGKFGGSLPLGLLSNLTSLRILDLSSNKFQGSITREIGCFRQLVELHLSDNELNGTVSPNLGLLTNLELLGISSNSLIGEISEIHFAKLKKLKILRLSYNSLTLKVKSSWIPPFQLEKIFMSSLKIGPHFPSLLQNQKNLNILIMANASISDDIPDWFEIVLSRINYLDLSFNNISGKVPTFKHQTLQSPLLRGIFTSFIAYLSDNCFSGGIPESICEVRSLTMLDLSNNQLSGRLPLCLGNLKELLVLKVSNNSLYGQIPSSLGNIELLLSLHLNKNKFHGKLPRSMQHLIHMQVLDLGENVLEGIIPSWIGKRLKKLRILRLQSNNFYGDVPGHLCQLSNLQVLNLAQNNLTGFIPYCFNNFSAMGLNYSDLKYFEYEDTSKGWIFITPEELHSFMGGRELEYQDNSILELRSLDLSRNHIIGVIPNELTDLVGLKSLNLSRNHLSGNIPEKIGDLKQLLSLDLSTNELSGSIPPSLANLNFLSYLNLSSNKLSGRIPAGNQLQTLEDPSTYAGNNGLCGKPLSNNCLDDKSSQEKEPSSEHKEDKEFSFSWFSAGLGPGFVVGLLGIFCILLFKKSWRISYFQLVENFATNIWVWSALKTSKFHRKLPHPHVP